jgi:6-phosphogluconolactonase
MHTQDGGFVYVQTNDADNNEIVVFGRQPDGSLDRLNAYPTGGKGSGAPHLPSQSSVVVAQGRLFVTNAGSDDVTVFDTGEGGLVLLDRVPSGGSAPRSLAVHGDRVYVLNTSDEPNVAAFELTREDGLVPLAGSTRFLGRGSDPAQVAATPDGRTLLVTDRASDTIAALAVDGGEVMRHPSVGATPYGFDIRPDGVLVVTEAAGAQIGKASASSYRLEGDAARLQPVTGAVASTRSEVCWAVISKDGRTVFVTNFGDGTISTYAIAADGSLELREAVAATTLEGEPGLRDEALSSDGKYLYALHADSGRVFAWEVRPGGALAPLGSTNGLPLTAAGLAAT